VTPTGVTPSRGPGGRGDAGGGPALLAENPGGAATALGGWLAPRAPDAEDPLRRGAADRLRDRLGDFHGAALLLPPRERERAELLAAWAGALAETASDADGAAARLARLNLAAFQLARALAGEPTASAFLRLLAAENARRAFGRAPLDALLAAARERAAAPRPASAADLARRVRATASGFTAALFGTEPSPAAADLAAGLARLAALRGLAASLGAERCPLPADALPEPLQYRRAEEIAAAVAAEAEALRPLLLRGARAVAEVPLSFRRPLAFLLPTSLELLAAIEERPGELAKRAPRLPAWSRRRAHWRARWTPL
jgi:hypothetical protein